jgi:type VI secretion system protein ImpJ
MRQLSPVLWTKGVLLAPQHLQAQDRYHDDALALQVGALSFCPWGFAELSFDREALAGGTLVVSSASGRFPDGLLFDAPRGDPAPPPRTLTELWRPDQRVMTVLFGVPEYRPDGRNVAPISSALPTRWRTDELLQRDETTGLAERPVQVARSNLRLLVEGESTEGYTTMPVARLLRSDAGAVSLDRSFVPPLLDLKASDYLTAMARRLVEVIAAKSATLSGGRRQRNQGLADFSVGDIAGFWLLYTLNTHEGTLRHLADVRGGHPSGLWDAMLALTGALTTFQPDQTVRTLPAYDHLRLGECFAALEARLLSLLDTSVPDIVVSLPLRPVRPTLHAVAIEQGSWLTAPQWFLAVSAPLRQADLVSKVLHGCKVGSADVVDTLIRQALPGLALAHAPQPPGAIPVKLDHQYFALRRDGTAWEAVERARNLAVYVPEELAQAKFELVIVLR